MPRLWVVTECYPRPAAPAACAFAHRQMAGLREAGWDVLVLVPNGWFPPVAWRVARAWRQAARSHVPDGFTLDGVRVADLTYQNRVPSRLCRPREHLARVTDALVDTMRRHGVAADRDVLLSQFALPYGPAVRHAARSLGLRYAVQLRGDDVWVWPHGTSDRLKGFVRTVGDADLLLAVSRALIDEASRLCGGAIPVSAVVPNGIDLARFRPPRDDAERARAREVLGLEPQALAVLCVGDAIERKGWRDLLDALGRLQLVGAPVVLLAAVGSLNAEIDIEREAQRRAPGVRVQVLRAVPGERLAAVYRAADVFCLASHWEGLANALLEAMASGLAVVTTGVAGHPEVVTDGVDGLLVPPRDVASLAHALGHVLAATTERARLGAAARARALAVGDSARAGRRLAALLDAVRSGCVPPERVGDNPYAEPERMAVSR